jgi:hypothetical protein
MFRLAIRIALFGAWVIVLLALLNGMKELLETYVDFSFLPPSMCWFASKIGLWNILSTFIAVMSSLYLKKMVFQYWSNS